MNIGIRARLHQMGLALADTPAPRGQYSSITVHNDTAYVAGQVSRLPDGVIIGPADEFTSKDTFKLAAETCALRVLSVLASVEDRYVIDRPLFLRGYVYSTADFTSHSAVLDPASELLHAVFGEKGSHARSAIGVASLPSAGLLEIELVVAVTARPQSRVPKKVREPADTLSSGDLQ